MSTCLPRIPVEEDTKSLHPKDTSANQFAEIFWKEFFKNTIWLNPKVCNKYGKNCKCSFSTQFDLKNFTHSDKITVAEFQSVHLNSRDVVF